MPAMSPLKRPIGVFLLATLALALAVVVQVRQKTAGRPGRVASCACCLLKARRLAPPSSQLDLPSPDSQADGGAR